MLPLLGRLQVIGGVRQLNATNVTELTDADGTI